jgi:uncharacterized membrane protein (DUF4010 family)
MHPAYAAGVIAASTVLVPRLLLVTILLNREVGFALAPYLAPPFLAGLVFTWRAARAPSAARTAADLAPRNPLRVGAALQMALAFQVVLLLLTLARTRFGDAGIYSSAALFGATDVDALAVAMTRMDSSGFAPVAARAIGVGVAANTLVKVGIAAAVGRGTYRLMTVAALGTMLAVLAAALLLLP